MTVVIAHRGASRAERENTVAAFRRAVELGAEGIELDVRRTSDDRLVVHHDPGLPDGRVIVDTPSTEIPGEHPSLDAALDACAGAFVNIEIKNLPGEPDFDPDDRAAELVAAALERRGVSGRWLISSFRAETVARSRSLLPAARTGWLVTELDEAAIRSAVGAGHDAVHPWVASLTAAAVRSCHAAGLVVNTWTCDDPDRMRELIAWGVDGIVTNLPDVALAVRAAGAARP